MRPDCDGFPQFPSDLKPQSESNICLRNLTSLVAMVGGAFLLIAMLVVMPSAFRHHDQGLLQFGEVANESFRWWDRDDKLCSKRSGPIFVDAWKRSKFKEYEVRDAFGDMWSEWVAVKCFETEKRHLKENREDAMKCDTMTAYLPLKNQYVPCIYWLLRDYDGEEAYGCVTGDKYLCDSHSVPDWPAKAREINKKYEDDCVEHLCKMAKEGTWSWQKQEEAAKSTPWQMVHDEFLKRGWKKAARKKCKRSKVHGNVGFEVPDLDSLLARVAVENKLHTFDKTICGCSSQDVCP